MSENKELSEHLGLEELREFWEAPESPNFFHNITITAEIIVDRWRQHTRLAVRPSLQEARVVLARTAFVLGTCHASRESFDTTLTKIIPLFGFR